jgi:radical SAM-linked protein
VCSSDLLPVRYSEGFHPMPRIVFATALPVGMESLAEIVDVELENRRPVQEIRERLNAVLPRGIDVLDVAEVHLSTPPSSLAERSTYWVPLDHLVTPDEASVKVRMALESQELVILQEREGKARSLDIRPLIERIEVLERPPARLAGRSAFPGSPEGEAGAEEARSWGLEIALRRGERGMAKPLEIVEHLLGIGKEALSGVRVVKFE